MTDVAKVRFVVERSTVGGITDLARVVDGEDPVEAIVAAAMDSLGVDVRLTVSGVTMHLAAWRDPEHWADDWREKCGDEDPVEFVERLLIERAAKAAWDAREARHEASGLKPIPWETDERRDAKRAFRQQFAGAFPSKPDEQTRGGVAAAIADALNVAGRAALTDREALRAADAAIRAFGGAVPYGGEPSELALRLADVQAAIALVETDEDGEIKPGQHGILSALDYAVRGDAGCVEPDEWAANRRKALAEHGGYLGLDAQPEREGGEDPDASDRWKSLPIEQQLAEMTRARDSAWQRAQALGEEVGNLEAVIDKALATTWEQDDDGAWCNADGDVQHADRLTALAALQPWWQEWGDRAWGLAGNAQEKIERLKADLAEQVQKGYDARNARGLSTDVLRDPPDDLLDAVAAGMNDRAWIVKVDGQGAVSLEDAARGFMIDLADRVDARHSPPSLSERGEDGRDDLAADLATLFSPAVWDTTQFGPVNWREVVGYVFHNAEKRGWSLSPAVALTVEGVTDEQIKAALVRLYNDGLGASDRDVKRSRAFIAALAAVSEGPERDPLEADRAEAEARLGAIHESSNTPPRQNATVTVKCVGCGHRDGVRGESGPRADDAVPMCSKCFSPMVAVRARRWEVTVVDGFGQFVSGPDTAPEGSGLTGMDWVKAAEVEVVEAAHVDEAVRRLREWAAYCATVVEGAVGSRRDLWQRRHDDAMGLVAMLEREP